ncbi:putative membrane protein [Pseudomonas syringae]|nr:putative membrane protein [Pseudomonas syringae]
MARCGLLGVLPIIPRISVRAQPSLTSHSASSGPSWLKSTSKASHEGCAVSVKPRSAPDYRADAPRRYAVRDAPRHTAVLRCQWYLRLTQVTFAPLRRLTLRDQSKQNPGSVSGPTSSGSFALTLIRRSPQRAIHGPVRLARRPASHPPDQRQRSAVTYVALCVVTAIVVEKHI